jgi:hypothetical protein
MTDRVEVARRAVLEKAILDQLRDGNNVTRDEARQLYEAGDADGVKVNGVTFGRVRRDKPRREWKIVDWAAFEKWVQANMPQAWIAIPQVDPGFRSTVLKHGQYIDVDGVVLEPDGIALVESDGNVVVVTTEAAETWALSVLAEQFKALEQ